MLLKYSLLSSLWFRNALIPSCYISDCGFIFLLQLSCIKSCGIVIATNMCEYNPCWSALQHKFAQFNISYIIYTMSFDASKVFQDSAALLKLCQVSFFLISGNNSMNSRSVCQEVFLVESVKDYVKHLDVRVPLVNRIDAKNRALGQPSVIK